MKDESKILYKALSLGYPNSKEAVEAVNNITKQVLLKKIVSIGCESYDAFKRAVERVEDIEFLIKFHDETEYLWKKMTVADRFGGNISNALRITCCKPDPQLPE